MPHQIMVVDDEPDLELLVRQKLRKQIREGEFEFFFAHHGLEALNLLAEQPGIDLVLSDINMPVMDGLTLLGKLAETGKTRRGVIVSAYGDMANIRTAMNRGAVDFLTKPIDFQDFEVTIRKSLAQIVELKGSMRTQEKLLALQHELGIAARIQQAILPRTFPPFPDRTDFEIHGAMAPAKEVGGDFFDFFLLDGDRVGFVIGDVSGKGVPAALFMAVSRTLLRGAALQGATPGECLTQVNTSLVGQNEGAGMFVTLFYGILNTRTGEIQFANGGHNTPYILSRDGKLRALAAPRAMLVGVVESAKYQTSTAQLLPGDTVVLYTDGVTEASDKDEEFFGEPRLEQYLAASPDKGVASLVLELHTLLGFFSAGAPQSDDITVLALRYHGQ